MIFKIICIGVIALFIRKLLIKLSVKNIKKIMKL
jgi:hypothetical protein